MYGRAREALDRSKVMEQARVAPSDVAFIDILNACSHASLVDEGGNSLTGWYKFMV